MESANKKRQLDTVGAPAALPPHAKGFVVKSALLNAMAIVLLAAGLARGQAPCGDGYITPQPVEGYVPRCMPQSIWNITGCCPLPNWAYKWVPRCGPLPCPTQLDPSCVR